MKVLWIQSGECKEWLLKKHYAHRMANITDSFGLYQDNYLVGVCSFGIPASNTLCKGVCGEQHSQKVRELNRLCIEDNFLLEHKNAPSFFIGACLRRMNHPEGRIIVSYADTSHNHVGYIYQATNFLYTGITVKRKEKVGDNLLGHSRHLSDNKELYKSLAYRERPQKHHYVIFLGTRKWKKIFKIDLNYPILPYPKGDIKHYDASAKVVTQGILF